jgi:hypothetical protein
LATYKGTEEKILIRKPGIQEADDESFPFLVSWLPYQSEFVSAIAMPLRVSVVSMSFYDPIAQPGLHAAFAFREGH